MRGGAHGEGVLKARVLSGLAFCLLEAIAVC